MGKFKIGSKNIKQVDIADLDIEILEMEPIVIEKEVIVEKLIQVPVEKIVNTHTIEYKNIEVPTEIIKEVIVEKIVTIENRKAIDELTLQLNEMNIFLKQKQVKIDDLEISIELKKEHLHEVREEHNSTVLDLNNEKSKNKILTIALVITSVIAILGVIF